MTLADSNPSSKPRTDRPYVVCDTCGHLWSVWVEPTVCGDCDSKALWAFPAIADALTHSRMIRERLQ